MGTSIQFAYLGLLHILAVLQSYKKFDGNYCFDCAQNLSCDIEAGSRDVTMTGMRGFDMALATQDKHI